MIYDKFLEKMLGFVYLLSMKESAVRSFISFDHQTHKMKVKEELSSLFYILIDWSISKVETWYGFWEQWGGESMGRGSLNNFVLFEMWALAREL